MITKNKSRGGRKQTIRGLGRGVPQNSGMDQDYDGWYTEKEFKIFNKPVDYGGVERTEYDPQLEEQWLAVRDEYRAHYPDLEDVNTEYEKGKFHTIINRLSKRRKRAPKQIVKEIMQWPSGK